MSDLSDEQLVIKAQLGDRDSLEQLISRAGLRLRADVYRLILEDDLTAEIVQETIFEMMKILNQLKDPQRFWPWIYKIAINKFRLHQRKQILHKTIPISTVNPSSDGKDGLTALIGEELKQSVFKAMRQLKPEHRAILTMRCYRQMDYALISDSLGCSQLAAKMLFYRAKKALAKQLSMQGYGKGSLLMGLLLFGKMTAESKAAAAGLSLTASSIKVALPVSLTGVILSKVGIITISIVSLLSIGTFVTTYNSKEQIANSPQQFVYSSVSIDNEQKIQKQCWYYFPQGPSGPVMIRQTEKDSQGRNSHYVLRQNEEGNYQFDKNTNTIYIRNCRWWNPDYSVLRLPTDSPGLRKFLSGIDGLEYQTQYVSSNTKGLLVIANEGSETKDQPSIITYQQHLLDEEYFQYNLPVGAKIADNRDQMHKRGWTYFTVTGNINGKSVNGRGRIPFVYAASRDYYPWLYLSIGDNLKVIDVPRQAGLYNQNNHTGFTCKSSEFFKGLPRPWMGLHTIDTIRRDAAEKELLFETKLLTNETHAEVGVTSGNYKLLYTIEMENDVLNKIELFSDNTSLGQLTFSYIQSINGKTGFTEPVLPSYSASQNLQNPGILWPVRLVQAEP